VAIILLSILKKILVKNFSKLIFNKKIHRFLEQIKTYKVLGITKSKNTFYFCISAL